MSEDSQRLRIDFQKIEEKLEPEWQPFLEKLRAELGIEGPGVKPVTDAFWSWPVAGEAYSLLPKKFRCKSRKRYVKKMMGLGMPRNLANFSAEQVPALRESYQRELTYHWILLTRNMRNGERG